MSNQPPKEITTPPDGYEWTGEVRTPTDDDIYGELWYNAGGIYWSAEKGPLDANNHTCRPILRKVKSPTLPVDLPREAVENLAKYWSPTAYWGAAAACREALEREND